MTRPAGFDRTRLARARWATAVVFVLLGVVQGSLAGRMPALKAHAGLSDSLLGLTLLGIPAGSILAAQVTGPWMTHRGSSPVVVAGCAFMCVTLVAPAFSPTFPTFLGAMIVVGFGVGLTDTAMNAHAVLVENGYGYAVFATFMVLTRFVSDRVVARLGPRRVLRWGGLVAGVGLAVGLATGTVVGTVVGCRLVGIGMAGVVPIVFTAAGVTPGMSAGYAVSKVAGVAFAGSLIGPPLIGFTAGLTSLRTALFLVAVAAVLIGLAGPRALRRGT